MPRAGFYNDNEYREYPFVFKQIYTDSELPTATIVDCGFIMGLDSGFDELQHVVYLAAIRKTQTTLQFEFRTTAPRSANFPIVFERAFDSDDWADEYADSAVATTGVFCATEPAWSGFMVSGRISELAADMTVGESRGYGGDAGPQRIVEPARIQSLVRSYLRSIGVANYARTVMKDCEAPGFSGNRQIIVNASCIKGHVRLQPGFNCRIRQNDPGRELQISAEKGINTAGPGSQEFCQNGSEIKLYPLEGPAPGSQFLSGGPACNEVITSINGLQAADVKIVGGSGIQVVADPNQANTIQIKRVENLISPTC